MNYFKTAAIILLSSIVSLYACNEDTTEDTDATEQIDAKSSEVSDAPTAPTSPAIAPAANTTMPNTMPAEPAQNAAGVWHYTCANGCAGGAGSAEGCATCGNVLVHNAAYHPAPGTPAPGSQAPGTSAPGQNTPEPAQNAIGVWHYTCSNGCSA